MESHRFVELDIMKFWGVLFVVLGHVCNMYLPNGLVHPAVQSGFLGHVSQFVYAFHMPLFVFISGSVYAYKTEVLGKRDNFLSLLKKKTKRLLIPYIVFSVFLVILMCGLGFRRDYTDYIFNGILLSKDSSHLWFILMLFDLFVIFFIMKKCMQLLSLPHWTVLILSFVFYLLSGYFPYILQISNAFRYLFWFTLGYVFILYKDEVQRIVLYSVCMVLCLIHLVIEHNVNLNIPFFSTITACAGIYFIYSFSCDFKLISRTSIFSIVSRNSFGIYLFHVFIIYLMFYFLKDIIFPAYLLAGGAFLLSILLSAFFSIVTRKLRMSIIIGE